MNSGNTVAAAQKQAAASKSSDESDTDKELNSAQGLNLSTAEEDSITSGEKKSDGESSVKINTVFAIALAVTGSGLVLILVTALIIWYFRKNWRRWGGEGLMTMMNIKSCISRGILVTVLAAAYPSSHRLCGSAPGRHENNHTDRDGGVHAGDHGPCGKTGSGSGKSQGTIHGGIPEDRSYFSGSCGYL